MEKGKKSVIVAEANPEAARLTERLLAANGYRVRIAPADEGLAALAREEGGATVLLAADAGSPDGFALARSLAQAPSAPAVVIVDGSPSVARAIMAGTVGAFDYLARPFPVTALRDVLGRACSVIASARVPRRLLEAYLAENGAAQAQAGDSVRVPGRKPGHAPAAARRSQLAEELVLLDVFAGRKIVGERQAAGLRERLEGQDPEASGRETLFAMLEALDSGLYAKCQAHLADLAKTPPVPLDAYPVLERNLGSADPALLERYSAVPFGRVADQTLVAMPNPASASARGELSAAFGGKCRFFICSASAARTALAKIRKLREGGADE